MTDIKCCPLVTNVSQILEYRDTAIRSFSPCGSRRGEEKTPKRICGSPQESSHDRGTGAELSTGSLQGKACYDRRIYQTGMAMNRGGLYEFFDTHLGTWRRRILVAISAVTVLVLIYAAIYRWAIGEFEGVSVTYLDAVQVVIEALTTAGFGGDTQHWNTDVMNAIVISMNLTGVILVFLAVPAFVVPLFRQVFGEQRAPRSTDLTNHVILCSITTHEDVLRNELDAADVPYLVIEEDEADVLELIDQGVNAIVGNPEEEQTLRQANVESARAVVVDVPEKRGVSTVLTIRELNESVQVISVTETETEAGYHRQAGADRALRPTQVLARGLARRALTSIGREIREYIDVADDLELTELVVKEDSNLVGQTLENAHLRERFGTTVVGVWSDGEFYPAPDPEFRITPGTIMLVAGSIEGLEAVRVRTEPNPEVNGDRIVLVGYGDVGNTIATRLAEADVPMTIVDMEDDPEVDVVGDITDPATLLDAEVRTARAIVLALDDDTATIYATVALGQIAPGVPVIARVNEIQDRKKLYRAGARYALALSTVTGRLLSSIILEGSELLAPETRFEIVRTQAPALAGQSLREAALGEQIGVTVIAAERNGELIVDIGPEFTIRPDDVLVVAGSDTTVNEFLSIAQ